MGCSWRRRSGSPAGGQASPNVIVPQEKFAVEQDLWIPGASQPGDEQHVEAVVSEVYVLERLKEVIELRERWLHLKSLPMDTQMRDNLERKEFLKWAKDLYHAEDFQRFRQAKNLETLSRKQAMHRKKSRWDRELQRRLGTSALWQMVSFTGNFESSFLQKGDDASTQSVEVKAPPTQNLTLAAQKARDRLRWAESLHRRQQNGQTDFTAHEEALLQQLAAGTLRTKANEATQKSGWGRIKHEDGTYEDIAPHHGGIVRTLLDHVVPTEADDDDAESMH